MKYLLVTNSHEETYQLGNQIGENLKGGEIICLSGELGAGKTVFAKGLAQGFGIIAEITSPTFTLIQEYPTPGEKLRLIHMDLYRLNYLEEAEAIGVPDYFREDCVCLIEWPDIISDLLPKDIYEITLEGSGDQPRTMTFCDHDQSNSILLSIFK